MRRFEHVVWWVGLLAAIGATAWCIRQHISRREVVRAVTPASNPRRPKVVSSLTLKSPNESEWCPPSASATASAWTFDLFTPPDLIVDSAGRFVERSSGGANAVGDSQPELIAVRRALFPVQLIGCVGDSESLVATFELGATGEQRLVMVGARIPGTEYDLVSLGDELRPTSSGGLERCVVAKVARGNEAPITLVGGHPQYTDEPVALCRLEGKRGAVRALHRGVVVPLGARRFVIENVDEESATLLVTDADSELRHSFELHAATAQTRASSGEQ